MNPTFVCIKIYTRHFVSNLLDSVYWLCQVFCMWKPYSTLLAFSSYFSVKIFLHNVLQWDSFFAMCVCINIFLSWHNVQNLLLHFWQVYCISTIFPKGISTFFCVKIMVENCNKYSNCTHYVCLYVLWKPCFTLFAYT